MSATGLSRLPADDERAPNNERDDEDERMQQQDGAQQDDDEPEPEPLNDAAIDDIYRRVVDELGGGEQSGPSTATSSSKNLTERESAFGHLIIRLCEHAKALSGQLEAQAEHIGHLQDQQAFLVDRQREERLRFDVERRAWARTAEVLVYQARKAGNNGRRIEDLEQALAMAKNANKQWEARCLLSEHSFSVFEGQVVNLGPSITFQPDVMVEGMKQLWYDNRMIIPGPPLPPQQQQPQAGPSNANANANTNGTVAKTTSKQVAGTKRKASDPPPPPPPPPRPIAVYQPPPTQPGPGPGPRRKAPLSADARTEHLLLASRKLSKERAALAKATGKLIASYPQPMHNTWYIPYRGPAQQAVPLGPPPPPPKEKEKENKEKEKEREKEKEKEPTQKEKEPPRTPARKRAAPAAGPVTPRTQPPGSTQRTPLDSLVSAARMLEQESPSRPSPSKRRKIAGAPMSALDVLAAQAVGSESDEDEDELLESEEDAPPLRSSLPTLREEEEDEVDELVDDTDTDEPPDPAPPVQLLGRGMRNRVPSAKSLPPAPAAKTTAGRNAPPPPKNQPPAKPAARNAPPPPAARSQPPPPARAPAPSQASSSAPPQLPHPMPMLMHMPPPPPYVNGSGLEDSPVAPARIRRMKGQTVWHKR